MAVHPIILPMGEMNKEEQAKKHIEKLRAEIRRVVLEELRALTGRDGRG